MKKMMQFEEATMELILFGFDVLTTSSGVEGDESFGTFNNSGSGDQNFDAYYED